MEFGMVEYTQELFPHSVGYRWFYSQQLVALRIFGSRGFAGRLFTCVGERQDNGGWKGAFGMGEISYINEKIWENDEAWDF